MHYPNFIIQVLESEITAWHSRNYLPGQHSLLRIIPNHSPVKYQIIIKRQLVGKHSVYRPAQSDIIKKYAQKHAGQNTAHDQEP